MYKIIDYHKHNYIKKKNRERNIGRYKSSYNDRSYFYDMVCGHGCPFFIKKNTFLVIWI
jgi:hypothetical protein